MAGGEPRSAADQDRLEEVKWLIAREIPHLRRYAMALARNRDEADDLVQDCLERAIRKRHQWRSQGSIRNWLFRTLYRTFLNGLPRRVREQGQIEFETGHAAHYESLGTAPHQESHLEWLDMAAALGRLPQQQRAAVLLVALEGMSYDEVAHILAVPVGTVRSRLSRARDTLRNVFMAGRSDVVEFRRVK